MTEAPKPPTELRPSGRELWLCQPESATACYLIISIMSRMFPIMGAQVVAIAVVMKIQGMMLITASKGDRDQ